MDAGKMDDYRSVAQLGQRMVSAGAGLGHCPSNDERSAMEGGPGVVTEEIAVAWMPGRWMIIGV